MIEGTSGSFVLAAIALNQKTPNCCGIWIGEGVVHDQGDTLPVGAVDWAEENRFLGS